MHNREVIEQVEQGYRMQVPRSFNCPAEVYNQMLSCWNKVPEKRPTFITLYNYFDDYFVTSQPNYIPPQN